MPWPKRGTAWKYPCGHPRTAANSRKVGVGNGYRCATCRREIDARSRAERKAKKP